MKKIITLSALALLTISSPAALIVEQWIGQGAGSTGLAGVDFAIASRPADISAVFSVIDFTDDPLGFAGDIPGSVPWPYAASTGQTSSGSFANTDFAARITTSLTITASDIYNFRTYSDDGVRLKIGSSVVINDDSYHPEDVRVGSIFLNPGTYPLELVFFEFNGEASLEFSVAQGTGPYGHVGGTSGPGTSVGVPDGGATLGLLSGALGIMGMARKYRRK